jgi:hypothetical protein
VDFESYLMSLNLEEEFREWLKTHPQALKESPMVSVVVFMHELFLKWKNDWESLNNLAEQFRHGGRGSARVASDVAYM